MSILNAAVTSTFKECTIRLKEILKKKSNPDEALMEMIRELVKETKAIRFSGNGYSDEWKKEAKKRGLPILNNTPEALRVFGNKKEVQFLIDTKVLTEEEIESRYHIAIERYVKTLEIEHLTLLEMTQTLVIPTVEKNLAPLYELQKSINHAGLKKQMATKIKTIEENLSKVMKSYDQVQTLITKLHKLKTEEEKSLFIVQSIQSACFELRDYCDQAETMTADELWPLPKYREILLAHTVAG